MPKKMLIKTEIRPRNHEVELKFALDAATATKQATNIPMIIQDEALGAPTGAFTHPEHASFAEVNEPNCYTDSHVERVLAKVTLSLNKALYETNKIHSILCYIIPVVFAFKEDYTAINPLNSVEVQDVLEMQTEATDRQGYPLFNGTKLSGGPLDLGANVPGLSTNTNIEAITMDMNLLYDALQYYSPKMTGKLKKVLGNIQHVIVKRNQPKTIPIRFFSNSAKHQNEYTYCGVIIGTYDDSSAKQLFQSGDVTAASHINVNVHYRYYEWHRKFYSEPI